MQFEIKKKLIAKTQKVKAIDIHQEYPWVLIGLFTGSVMIYDYNSQSCLHYVECNQSPVRAVKFIPAKNLFVVGSDDKILRFFNYNTSEKVHEVKDAHNDFIRAIALKPFDSKIITSSDDGTIKLWNIGDTVTEERAFEEHKKYVMGLAVSSTDTNSFASASMDKRVKLWAYHVSNSQMTFEGHKSGVTSVAFCPYPNKPYLASGSDDKTIIVNK